MRPCHTRQGLRAARPADSLHHFPAWRLMDSEEPRLSSSSRREENHMYRNVSLRLLSALPLAFVVLACGGDPSAEQPTTAPEQAAAEKPFDSGDTQPVTPAPSTMADRAIDLRPRGRSTGGVQ